MFSVAVLLYGDHLPLAQRCLRSISDSLNNDRSLVADIRIGCNVVCEATQKFTKGWAQEMSLSGIPVITYTPFKNAMKYPLMRRMFYDPEAPLAEYVMWFDDDSYLEQGGSWWQQVWQEAQACDMLGQYIWYVPMQGQQWEWIKTQSWYNPDVGMPPRWKRWPHAMLFCQGSWWVLRSEVIRRYDWPTTALRHCGGDSMLGELCRHQSLVSHKFVQGVKLNADDQGRNSKAHRRGLDEPVIGKNFVKGELLDVSHQQFGLERIVYACPHRQA